MRLETKSANGEILLSVYDSVSSLSDALEVRESMEKLISTYPDYKMVVQIYDAVVMPSSLIGTMLKISEINKVNLVIRVAKDELIDGLHKLKLDEILKIEKLK